VKLITASDGEAALQAAKQSKPDLIIADVLMPKLGGYELCQRVRADAALKDVPVLLLGGPAPIDPAKAMAVGANGHMPKPFDSSKLIEHVKTILANPKAKPIIASAAKPGMAAGRPPAPASPAKPAVSPGGSGSTMVMPRPPMPAGAPSKPPTSNPPRAPSPPAVPAPPGAPRPAPPPAKPPVPDAPAGRMSTPPIPAPSPARPGAPPTRPPPAVTSRPPPAAPPIDDDEEIPLDEEVIDEVASPTPTPLRSVPSAAHKPSLSVVPPPADGGEAMLREALSKASREVIEKIAWEVVPELAETIIREELERLIKERGS
jgi:CheY-like chemotaxis protein